MKVGNAPALVRRTLRRWRRLGARLVAPFPVVPGNELRFFPGTEAALTAIRAAIGAARHSVDVEMYLWDDDDEGRAFATALADAAERGVRVRVLADALGAREALAGCLRGVAARGVALRVFDVRSLPLVRRLMHRTHKKLVVVDGAAAWCGGAGFSRHFTRGTLRELPWHDRMFEVRGPLVAQVAAIFAADFERFGPRRPLAPAAVTDAPPPCGTAVGRALRGWPDPRDFTGTFLVAVSRARERVLIGTPYFMPPFRLRRALRAALRRGVDVQLVLPSHEGASRILWYASRRHLGGFLRRGARVFEFGPAFYHAKLAVVDRDHAFLGSSNMDAWSWRRNAEIDFVFHDADTVERVAMCFAEDRAAAREVTAAEHHARGPLHRLFERIAGIFDEWW